jgi:hypothetical protein
MRIHGTTRIVLGARVVPLVAELRHDAAAIDACIARRAAVVVVGGGAHTFLVPGTDAWYALTMVSAGASAGHFSEVRSYPAAAASARIATARDAVPVGAFTCPSFSSTMLELRAQTMDGPLEVSIGPLVFSNGVRV